MQMEREKNSKTVKVEDSKAFKNNENDSSQDSISSNYKKMSSQDLKKLKLITF